MGTRPEPCPASQLFHAPIACSTGSVVDVWELGQGRFSDGGQAGGEAAHERSGRSVR